MKPRYIDPFAVDGSDALSFRPPLLFRDVTIRSFPLKANIARLTQFCDQYLNMDIPDTIVRFTPALPYVYLMVLNYGGISATSMEAQRLGWVAQHEVLFLVPLNRWRRENGKLVFKGWTSATPFIFVDDPMSMVTGREVYGWPKMQAFIDADKPLWGKHPRAPTRLFTMSTNVFADVYAGQEEPPRVLVTVDRDTVASYAEFPPDLKCPWSPTSLWPNVIRNSLSLMGEAIDIAAGLRSRGYPPGRDLRAIGAMTGQALTMGESLLAGLLPPSLSALLGRRRPPPDPYGQTAGVRQPDLPPFFTSSLNLKQFRNPEQPEFACYTALVDSAMGVDRLNQIGLLGDWDLLRGDPSGGYSISIHRYQSQPIIESLGIEVPAVYQDARNGDAVVLRPTFPYWMDVDLYYGAGKLICSRTSYLPDNDWMDERGEPRPAARGAADIKQQAPRVVSNPPAFNTALGAATEAIVGPFHFPDLTLQVYPLLADREKLANFIEASWNRLFDGPAPPLQLEALGSYVYMIVSVIGNERGTMWSNANNLGWWAEREVAFCIPVKWRNRGELISVAMIEPFVYANKAREVVTDREVNGRNTMKAQIESPPDIWMTSQGPADRRRLAHVRTETYNALGLGQDARTQTLIEINECDPLPAPDIEGWRKVAVDWGGVLADDLKRKAWLRGTPAAREAIVGVQNLALEALARSAPVNRLTLKQYRDAADPERACYQAVVHTQREITEVYEIREIDRPVHVTISRLPNHPIVETLGLRVKHLRSDSQGVADCLQPIRPFWMRIGVKENLGSVIATVDPINSRQDPSSTNGDARRLWMSDHPWFSDNAQGARKRVEPPYFRQPGLCSVGAKWNELLPMDGRRGLRGAIQVRSRRALKYELAWNRSQIAFLPREKRNALQDAMRQRPEAGSYAALMRARARPIWPPGANSFIAFVSARTNEEMGALATAIDGAAESIGQAMPPAPDLGSHSAGLGRIGLRYLEIERMPEADRRALEQAIRKPEGTRRKYDALAQAFAPAEAGAGATAWLREATPEDLQALEAAMAARKPARATQSKAGVASDREGLSAIPGESAPDRGGDLVAWIKRVERWILQPPSSEGAPPWRKTLSAQAVESFDNIRLKRFLAEFDLDNPRRRLLAMTVDLGAWEALASLDALIQAPDGGSFADRQREYEHALLHGQAGGRLEPAAALKTFSDAFGVAVEDWRQPSRWRRFSRAEAAEAVEKVHDIQLAFEAILRDGWETAGEPGNVSPLPYAHIPASSIGPIGSDPNAAWASLHGLERWPEPSSGAPIFVASGAPIAPEDS